MSTTRSAEEIFRSITRRRSLDAVENHAIRRLFSRERFENLTRSQFVTDKDTDKESQRLNILMSQVVGNTRDYYGYPGLSDLDIHVGVVRDPYPNAACLAWPIDEQAIILWNSGIKDAFQMLAILLQRLTAIDEPDIAEDWRRYVDSWCDLLDSTQNAELEFSSPEIIKPVYRRPPQLDLPDYNQPQPETFYQATVHFLLGHELGHVFLDLYLQREDMPGASEFLEAVNKLRADQQAACEEMICDEIGLYSSIAFCLRRWSGRVVNNGFTFEAGTNGDKWGGARNRHNFEGYLADSMSAIWMLFYYQQCLDSRTGSSSRKQDFHPAAVTRIKALLSGQAGSLLSSRTSLLSERFNRYGARLLGEVGVDINVDDRKEERLLECLEKYRSHLAVLTPHLEHEHWGLKPKAMTTKSGGVVGYFPESLGGVYRDGVPEDVLLKGHGMTMKPDGSMVRMSKREHEESIRAIFHGSTATPKTSKKTNKRRMGMFGKIGKRLKDAARAGSAAKHYNAGIRLRQSRRTAESIGEFSEAIRLFPYIASFFFNRANAYQQSQRHDLAIADYEEAVKLEPQHFKAWCNMGMSLIQVRKFDEALQCLDKAAFLGDEKAQQLAAIARQQLESQGTINFLMV